MKITQRTDDCLILRGSSVVGDIVVGSIALTVFSIGIAATVLGTPAALIPVGLAVAIGGLAFWAVHHRTDVRFEKTSSAFTLRRKMLHKTIEIDLNLDEIVQADVDLKAEHNNNSKLHPRHSYRLCVVTGELASRQRIPIGHGYTNNRRHKVVAEKINEWLGVPDAQVGMGPGLKDLQKVASALGFDRVGN